MDPNPRGSAPPIFVFGSNLKGIHGAGSAKTAAQRYGAKFGIGEGRTGDAYALPTCSAPGVPLTLDEIRAAADRFIAYAEAHPELSFEMVPVGCGIAGFLQEEISPLFEKAPPNVKLPPLWRSYLAAIRDLDLARLLIRVKHEEPSREGVAVVMDTDGDVVEMEELDRFMEWGLIPGDDSGENSSIREVTGYVAAGTKYLAAIATEWEDEEEVASAEVRLFHSREDAMRAIKAAAYKPKDQT